MNILAFGASTSKQSINQRFAVYAVQSFAGETIQVLDLNDFPLPVFSVDLEVEAGHPTVINEFIAKLDWADVIIISLAEHNGSYAAAFKNLFDWASRVKGEMFKGKKLILLATSPGARGGQTVLATALSRFPFHGAEIVGHFSLPKFNENFHADAGITEPQLLSEFNLMIEQAKASLS
jgi:chromate reductase, NAD(P)H dehydrogenase (quinone)